MGASAAAPPLTIPINQVIDSRIQWGEEKTERLWSRIWLEAVRDLDTAAFTFKANRELRKSADLRAGSPRSMGSNHE